MQNAIQLGLPTERQAIAEQNLRVAQASISGPFAAEPMLVPGTIQAEDFDRGCEGVAYHVMSHQAMGDAAAQSYRISSVYLDPCQDEKDGFNIGHIEAGEWLTYTVAVSETGFYDLDLRLSNVSSGGQVRVEVYDNMAATDLTGSLSVPNTKNWQKWKTVTRHGIYLNAGRHVLRVCFDRKAGGPQYICNFNWMRFSKSQPPIQAGGNQDAATLEIKHELGPRPTSPTTTPAPDPTAGK
jgi:hypothetical protein